MKRYTQHMFEIRTTEKSESLNRKTNNTLLKSALLASALWSQTPQAADAWTNKERIPEEQIEKIFTNIGLPPPDTLMHVEVSYVVPSENGQYIVHIRQQHKSPNTISAEDIAETALIQKEIYETIKELNTVDSLVSYAPEGYSRNDIDDISRDKDFYQYIIKMISDLVTESSESPIDLEVLFKEINRYHSVTQGTLTRVGQENLAATILNILKKSRLDSSRYDATALDTYLFRTKNYEDILFYQKGGLAQAYNEGFISNLVGCENPAVYRGFGEELTAEYVTSVNQERESFSANCFAESLSMNPNQKYMVTVYGGSHNFEQEIPNGYGYIVLTPDHYNPEYATYTKD